MFEIKNDWLNVDGTPITKMTPTVNKLSTGTNTCEFLIYHFTASGGAQSAINNLMDPNTKLSWHMTIDRNGKIVQHYPFKKITWHAGVSSWTQQGQTWNGLNPYAIGIEMANWGQLTYENGNYVSWTKTVVPQSDVFFKDGHPWHKFTDIQIAVAKEVGKAICAAYKPKNILGHMHIAPGRKSDPGPAFVDALNDIRRTYGLSSI